MFAGIVAGPVAAAAPQPNADQVARGEYLATIGDCMSCHTAHDGQKFAGGRYMPTPFGPISTPNITPDMQTGIGDWTDDDFYHALHDGIGKGGQHLYPVMPYPWYTKVTRDDVLAIKAYLFSLPPMHAPRPPSKLAFPFNIRAGLAVWNEAFFTAGTFAPIAGKSAEVNRGAYIVQGLGHCGECHNGRNLLGNTPEAQQLQGGEIEDWYAPNITADVHEGIGRFTDAQVFAFLKTGVSPGMGTVVGPMAEAVHDSLSKLTDADVHAIIAYLRSTPPETNHANGLETAYTGPDPAGRRTYLNNCASCHQLDGKGVGNSVPSLVGNAAVGAGGSEDVIRVILGGVEAQGTYAPMPAIGTSMTDQQVADVTNYVRQAWGNTAPPNAGAGTVGALRGKTFTAMSIGPDGHCPKIVPPKLAAVIADPNSGIANALTSMTPGNMLQTIGQILPKVKAADPDAKQNDIVNSLTIAYCPIVAQSPSVPANLKVPQLDQFSERVYSELQTNGNE
jgi:mono/diheme cytochrome c family protein